MSTSTQQKKLETHLAQVKTCALCPNMIGPVVVPRPILTKVYLVGQAPGPREGQFGHPFAWTAGKTLFRWFETIGVNEEQFRSTAFIGAVCRCFPGKTKQGTDRVPSPVEVAACSTWMKIEIDMLRPELIIAVGRLAIERFLPPGPLAEIIGKTFKIDAFGHACDLIPLPHPSGASTWYKMEPGKKLLEVALLQLKKHPAWMRLLK